MDAVTADLRVHEARQSFLIRKSDQKADFISAEVLTAEFKCKAQDISNLLESDEDFRQDMCLAIAAIVRDPKDLRQMHIVINSFDHAIERVALKDWNEREAA